jgi:hypothetical protein
MGGESARSADSQPATRRGASTAELGSAASRVLLGSSFPTKQPDGIPLGVVLLAAAGVLLVGAVGVAVYFRSLAQALLSDTPLALAPVLPDDRELAATTAKIEAARAARGEVALGEEEANGVLFEELARAPDGPVVWLGLAEPYVRIAFRERDAGSGKWLNAELLATPYAPEGGGLAFRVLSGKVGRVSIASTEGEWVRGKIERQLAAELAGNARVRALFAGLKTVRVAGGRLVCGF